MKSQEEIRTHLKNKEQLQLKLEEAKLRRSEWFEEWLKSPSDRREARYEGAKDEVGRILKEISSLVKNFWNN